MGGHFSYIDRLCVIAFTVSLFLADAAVAQSCTTNNDCMPISSDNKRCVNGSCQAQGTCLTTDPNYNICMCSFPSAQFVNGTCVVNDSPNGSPINVPEMSEMLIALFFVAGGAIVYYRRRKTRNS